MKKILLFTILALLVSSCFDKDPYKCINYTGDKECVRFYDGEEFVIEMKE